MGRNYTPNNYKAGQAFGWFTVNADIYDDHAITYPNDPRLAATFISEYTNNNPTNNHPGGAGGSAGTASDGYNAGGGTVILVTSTKPLPSLTLAAAAGTGGSGSASAGSVITVFNIDADDTDPSG